MNGLNDVFQHPDITLMPSHTASAVPLGNATSQSLWSWPRWDMPWSRGLSLSLDAMFWANDFQLSSHLHFFLFEMLLQFGVCTMNPAHALQWILLSTSGFWFLQWTVVGNHLNHHGFFALAVECNWKNNATTMIALKCRVGVLDWQDMIGSRPLVYMADDFQPYAGAIGCLSPENGHLKAEGKVVLAMDWHGEGSRFLLEARQGRLR